MHIVSDNFPSDQACAVAKRRRRHHQCIGGPCRVHSWMHPFFPAGGSEHEGCIEAISLTLFDLRAALKKHMKCTI
jgi:hypothetical protein